MVMMTTATMMMVIIMIMMCVMMMMTFVYLFAELKKIVKRVCHCFEKTCGLILDCKQCLCAKVGVQNPFV